MSLYILLHENELIDFYSFFCVCVVGGLVYGNTFHQGMQYHAWTSFIFDSMFCIRACHGFRASELYNNIYDEMGCEWVHFSLTHSLFSFVYTRSFSPPQNRTCPATTNPVSLKSAKAMMRMSFLSFLLFFLTFEGIF